MATQLEVTGTKTGTRKHLRVPGSSSTCCGVSAFGTYRRGERDELLPYVTCRSCRTANQDRQQMKPVRDMDLDEMIDYAELIGVDVEAVTEFSRIDEDELRDILTIEQQAADWMEAGWSPLDAEWGCYLVMVNDKGEHLYVHPEGTDGPFANHDAMMEATS